MYILQLSERIRTDSHQLRFETVLDNEIRNIQTITDRKCQNIQLIYEWKGYSQQMKMNVTELKTSQKRFVKRSGNLIVCLGPSYV